MREKEREKEKEKEKEQEQEQEKEKEQEQEQEQEQEKEKEKERERERERECVFERESIKIHACPNEGNLRFLNLTIRMLVFGGLCQYNCLLVFQPQGLARGSKGLPPYSLKTYSDTKPYTRNRFYG